MHPMAAYAALRGVRVFRHTSPSTEWHPCRLFGPAGPANYASLLAYHPRTGWDDSFAYTVALYEEAAFTDVPDDAWERLQDHHLAVLDIR